MPGLRVPGIYYARWPRLGRHAPSGITKAFQPRALSSVHRDDADAAARHQTADPDLANRYVIDPAV
jgi:hypothetical protein